MLAAAAAVLLLLYRWENRPTAQTEDDPYAGEDESLTYYNGGWYARRDVETVLVMGVDKYAAQTSGDNYNQQQQADFLLLLVVDRTAGVCRVLPLNRDTMTEITALGLAGEQVGTFNGQLALSHTYGSGGLDSARNTGRAVSSLLYGVDIDHVMAFTMDAVPVINDAVGGVTVLVEDDFSAVTDQLPMGQEVTLHGDLALTFVQSRGDMGGEKTNINRMSRQAAYLRGLYTRLQSAAQDEGFLTQLLLELSSYLTTDCTANQLNDLYRTVSQDRLEVLDLLEGYLMPYGTVKTVLVEDDVAIITMSGMDLEQISAMFQRVQQQPIVKSASLTIAATPRLSRTDLLDFSVTITLQPADKEAAA